MHECISFSDDIERKNVFLWAFPKLPYPHPCMYLFICICMYTCFISSSSVFAWESSSSSFPWASLLIWLRVKTWLGFRVKLWFWSMVNICCFELFTTSHLYRKEQVRLGFEFLTPILQLLLIGISLVLPLHQAVPHLATKAKDTDNQETLKFYWGSTFVLFTVFFIIVLVFYHSISYISTCESRASLLSATSVISLWRSSTVLISLQTQENETTMRWRCQPSAELNNCDLET